jgi:hypothetical protein
MRFSVVDDTCAQTSIASMAAVVMPGFYVGSCIGLWALVKGSGRRIYVVRLNANVCWLLIVGAGRIFLYVIFLGVMKFRVPEVRIVCLAYVKESRRQNDTHISLSCWACEGFGISAKMTLMKL